MFCSNAKTIDDVLTTTPSPRGSPMLESASGHGQTCSYAAPAAALTGPSMDDIAARLTTLLALAAVEVRFRCGPMANIPKRQAMTATVLTELGLGDLRLGRATYTLRRRIAARVRLEQLATLPAAIK
jgi:hypothetical protein